MFMAQPIRLVLSLCGQPTCQFLEIIQYDFLDILIFTDFHLILISSTTDSYWQEGDENQNVSEVLFTWRRASLPRRASPLCRDLTLQVYSFIKFFFVYMRGGLAHLGEISLFSTRDLA